MKKIRIIGFSLKTWQFEMGEKNLQMAVLGYVFIYVQTKH